MGQDSEDVALGETHLSGDGSVVLVHSPRIADDGPAITGNVITRSALASWPSNFGSPLIHLNGALIAVITVAVAVAAIAIAGATGAASASRIVAIAATVVAECW
jgi:hypothetical protein